MIKSQDEGTQLCRTNAWAGNVGYFSITYHEWSTFAYIGLGFRYYRNDYAYPNSSTANGGRALLGNCASHANAGLYYVDNGIIITYVSERGGFRL
jgi:hypothetical protein